MSENKNTEQEQIEQMADENRSWLESAVGDMAYAEMEWNGTSYTEAEIQADKLYNDPQALSDILGDRIFDCSSQLGYGGDYDSQKIAMWSIAEAMKPHAHTALIQALENLQSRWSK